MVSTLDKNTEFNSVRDVMDSLKVPNLIALDIPNGHHYQIDFYFNILIEPSIAYTYPNQY